MLGHNFDEIISLENLCGAWQEFAVGKQRKRDVQEFSRNLMDNILALHSDLVNRTYRHGEYYSFYINDPKRRHIHKASVRDRLLHHAVYCILYPFFDRTFIVDSYSCRNSKGIHKAINQFRTFANIVGKNNKHTVWVLKCDIKQYFASVDHEILFAILNDYIPDQNILWLLRTIVDSFKTSYNHAAGLPLGNLTSQILTNIYMNRFDQWVKHTLKAKYYIRYADDFVFLSTDRVQLENYIPRVRNFLQSELKRTLHPDKIILKTFFSGVDFLGWIHFPSHRVLRGKTRERMLRKIRQTPEDSTLQSYLGLLGHGDTCKNKINCWGNFGCGKKIKLVQTYHLR